MIENLRYVHLGIEDHGEISSCREIAVAQQTQSTGATIRETQNNASWLIERTR